MFTEETENRIASFFNELANTLNESLTALCAVKDSVTYHPPTIFTYLSNHKDFIDINDIIINTPIVIASAINVIPLLFSFFMISSLSFLSYK
jgi:hypothetical protein